MDSLLTLIENDDPFSVSRNFYQELIAYLHVTGLHTVAVLHQNPVQVLNKKLHGRLGRWPALPSLIAITVEVPRSSLKFFTDMKLGQAGTPSFCCSLKSTQNAGSQWMCQFSVVQSGFGIVVANKTINSDELSIKVDEDEMRWKGSSSLIVSFYAPTWILLQEEDSTCITVGFQSTTQAAKTYVKHLGLNLHFFETKMSDSKVHVSRYMPSQQRLPLIVPRIHGETPERIFAEHIARSTLSAGFNSSKSTINSLVATIEVQDVGKDVLAEKSTVVQVKQVSVMELEVLIGGKLSYVQGFPRPVSATRSKLRIARKSSYIEVIAPFLNPLDQDKIDAFVYAVTLSASTSSDYIYPVILNSHVVNSDACPIIDDRRANALDWISVHTAMMFSGREREQRERGTVMATTKDVRVDFKDGLFSMFMHSTGVQGQRARIFGLHKAVGGVDTLIFVSKVRLDLNDRVVFLDAAVIPLRHSIMRDPLTGSVLSKMQSSSRPLLMMINVDETELKLWKSTFPTLAERCRSWNHKSKSCEYIKHGAVPVPGGLEPARTPLCSCGLGQIPKDFMRGTNADVPGLGEFLRKYGTRIAISPVFYVPHVESGIDLNTFRSASRPTTVSAELNRSTVEGCAVCGKQGARGTSSTTSALLKCARCKIVKYCSKDCQKADWKDHKPVCKQ